ncbi:MAG: hypothetical protein HKN47_20205, partial [Pirellulaceae bacterium]|nr:hypothetical protein [Pirellulaceae bacterium]
TKVDAGLSNWLAKAKNLTEVDLSWTPIDDAGVVALSDAHDLEVLWLTGSKVTDQSIDQIARFRKLESVDVQRTGITDAGLARLKAARPGLSINPLELRTK